MGLAEDILAFNDTKIEHCPVPEWGDFGQKIYVRTMSAVQRDYWEAQLYIRSQQSTDRVYENLKARVAALCLCNEIGVPLFTVEHTQALGEKDATALERVYAVAARLNNLNKKE